MLLAYEDFNMADMHENTVTVTEDLKICVESGTYGKFVRIMKKDK